MPLRFAFLTSLLCLAVLAQAAPSETVVDRSERTMLEAPSSPSDRPIDDDALGAPAALTWTADQVRVWAAAASPTAQLLGSEWRAVGASFDRRDSAECKRAGMLQSVLTPLAAHERNESAADALRVYYRIVGIERQQAELEQAIKIVGELVNFAERAEELQIPDGDPNLLRRRQLELQGRRAEAEYGEKQLRVQLAQLTDQSREDASSASLVDPLEFTFLPSDPQQAADDAVTHRQDLQAIEKLCCQIQTDTLPAVRQLFAGLQPGLGLAAASAGGQSLLLALHASKSSNGDLGYRRQQCYALRDARREQIISETLAAAYNLAGLVERVSLAETRVELAESAFQESESGVELDQMTIGTDKQRQLELLEVRVEHIQLLIDTAVANVQLREARGVADQP